MSSTHHRKTKSLAEQATELAFAVPQVVVHRVTRMLLAGPAPSARDQKEFQLMSDEKTTAFTESWNAMAAQAVQAHQALSLSMVESFWMLMAGGVPATAQAKPWETAALDILSQGMAPLHRRAVANARRLARTPMR